MREPARELAPRCRGCATARGRGTLRDTGAWQAAELVIEAKRPRAEMVRSEAQWTRVQRAEEAMRKLESVKKKKYHYCY